MLRGGYGDDRFALTGTNTAVEGGDGDDRVEAAAAKGALRIDVGDGANVVEASGDGTSVAAGDGPDAVDLSAATGAVVVASRGGADRVDVGGSGSRVDSGDGPDLIDASSATGAVRMDAGDGDDRVTLGGVGSAAAGGAGNDIIDAVEGRGHTSVDGGDGNDRIAVGGDSPVVVGGAGDDEIESIDASGPAELNGEAGSDRLTGGSYGDVLRGGEGVDILDGAAGPNGLDGGSGDDVLTGGADGSAGEQLAGGEGYDRVTYEGSAVGVRVAIGGPADDGAPGEHDNVVADVERVDGSDDDDVLAAGFRSASLVGGAGDDSLVGGPNSDTLAGGLGDDRLDGGLQATGDQFAGGQGEDEITYAARTTGVRVDMRRRDAQGGAPGERDVYQDPIERIVGGKGPDIIIGQPGVAHIVAAGAGQDLIRIADSHPVSDAAADRVRCQGNDDRVEGDRLDVVSQDCEHVLVDGKLRRASAVLPPLMRIAGSRDGRRLRIRVRCDRDTLTFCSTKLVVRIAGTTRTLARVDRVHVRPGRSRWIRLTATSDRAARILARRTRVLVVVVVRDKLGRGSLTKRSGIVLRPERPKLDRPGDGSSNSADGSTPSTGRAAG